MSARRWAAGLGGATVLALTAGCGMLGIGGGGDDDKSDEERLVEMLNESARLESEIAAAENRIVQNCLEEAGHTVHEPGYFENYEPEEVKSLTYSYPHESFILPAEEAAEFGFGGWTNSEEGMEDPATEEYYEAQEAKWEEEEGGGEEYVEPDYTEWEALTPEEQYAWYVAYQGEEYVEQNYGTEAEYASMYSEEEMVEELTEEEAAALEEEAAAEEEGEIDVEAPEAYEEPKPGGCQLEMIEALYGEPRQVESTYEMDGETYTDKYWEYRPENPTYGGEEDGEDMWANIEAEYAAEMGDKQAEYIDCITGRGYEGWEFNEYNTLPTWEFFYELYYQNVSDDERDMWMDTDSETVVPPMPEDAGDSYEEWKAYEIQMAVDFAECGDEVGFADPSEKAYDKANIDVYLEIEQDVYAWQDDMRDAIAKAQELLDK
ncbi:hypothetical protein [Glycomyces sp. NPDC048151]|uniref:hypothetical protein n=1 Tax=Glycomyces sp. NPDC048151 TaxID=3364002 RepID=UPI00371C0E9B